MLTGGFGGEVAAWAAEHCFTDLDAPVRRVAALDTHVPYEPRLEQAVLPQVDDIDAALVDTATSDGISPVSRSRLQRPEPRRDGTSLRP